MLVCTFINEEQKKVGSWRVGYFRHTRRPCSTRHWYRLLGIKWPHSRSCFRDFQIPSPSPSPSLNRGWSLGHHRWLHNQFPPFFSVHHRFPRLDELKACPFSDIVFPALLLSTLSSSPFHCASQDGFGQTWWTVDMSIPLQFASLFRMVRSSCGPIAC